MSKTTEKLSHTSAKPHKRLLADTWFLEIASLLLGIGAFIVIIVLLSHYDGKQQFQWNGVTLNAVVSVLATIARIGIVVPVAEALAQWKWMHFSNGYKPLSDFGLLDDASRGTRGSLLLLWEKKSLTLTSVGSWIIVLSIAVEPFFQQIISFEDAVSFEDNSNVKISYATLWDGGTYAITPPSTASASSNASGLYEHVSTYGSVSDLTLDFQAQAAILFGLSTTLKNVNQQLKTTCPSGNCTWPSYRTLGTCSKCNDVTDQISRSQKVDFPMAWYFPTAGNPSVGSGPINITTYSLPNGLALDNRDPNQNQVYTDESDPVLMTARSNVAPSQSVSFKDATTLLWSAATLYVPNSTYAIDGYGQWYDPTASNVRATECAIYLCVKEYTSQILNGQLLESYTDIASTRDAASWQVSFNTDGSAADITGYVYSDGVSPAVDALYTNTTYLTRTDLSISVPQNASNLDGNNLTIVNATQAAIYALSAYLANLFTSTTLTNASLPPPAGNFSCTLNSTSIPCGHLGNVTGMVILSEPNSSLNKTQFDPPAITAFYDPELGDQTLTSVFATLAESISNAMRGPTENASTIPGQLGTSHTLLRVRWPWITLPLLCMVISTSFLLFSVYEAHVDSTPLWKSGGLAYLAHGLDARSSDKVKLAELSSEIDAAAEKVKVRLDRDEDGVLMLRYGGEEVAIKSKSEGKDGHDNMNGNGARAVLSRGADAHRQA